MSLATALMRQELSEAALKRIVANRQHFLGSIPLHSFHSNNSDTVCVSILCC